MKLFDAVKEAARQRFRPIVMTSMAFSLGVTPLVLSSGAGAAGRNAIGFAVLGGTLSATILGVLFVPTFFVMVRSLVPFKPNAKKEDKPGGESDAGAGHAPTPAPAE